MNRMENLSRVLKKIIKRLSFVTQFEIKFLLPFTYCRKVLGKMLAYMSRLAYISQWVTLASLGVV